MTTLITQTIAKVVVPLCVFLSISLLLTGHDQPGGGFIGGVMFATAISLLYISFGLDDSKKFFNPDWSLYFGFGLLLATAAGIGSIIAGYNLLRTDYTYLQLPLFGEVELSSAIVFDIGVYLVVIGGLLFIFKKMGED
ncbi:MnhB domain-containing protein [Methanosalsum natronophilum]|uniref:Cation:proton antiporter n=1 Tax=Methanosalsum natronophilum TaxID=768733 RepID=A0A3R7YIW7_9EURY|nr:MnhB domain-containing protein [Methanosalsum natronophilum]MCS3924189.1 multicomponent Na+:H+ antiporter subunit B [Methanosalsum natronophilum]RQD87532.1 MAG: cation:proton antiporter [Methanosalsum natronophilum]